MIIDNITFLYYYIDVKTPGFNPLINSAEDLFNGGNMVYVAVGAYLLFCLIGGVTTAIVLEVNRLRNKTPQRICWDNLAVSGFTNPEWDPDEQYRRKQGARRRTCRLFPRIMMFAIGQDGWKREVPDGGKVFLGETVELHALV
jgi:hypothetical protein